MDSLLHYKGSIFDAHSHVVDSQALNLMVSIASKYNVKKSVLIVHGDSIRSYQEAYPDRFIYAKYFSGWSLFGEGVDEAIHEVRMMRDEGYSVAKMHFAPFWTDRMPELPHIPRLQSEDFDPFFDALADEEIPILIHVADPDTYFNSRYSDKSKYGTKDEHLKNLEARLKKSPQNTFQVAHFGAQPELHRLENLSRMFEQYPNLHVDTGSARWMVRELGKNPRISHDFLVKHSDRILFGSDCVARTDDASYYEGRFSSERMLWETGVRDVPLPFIDSDTVEEGGTFINGLNLPESVLEKLYWENAIRIHTF